MHDQLQPRSLNRYGAEWLLDLTARGRMRVGMDRLVDLQRKRGYYVPVLGLTLKLPGGHRLQLTYSGERGTHMLSFVIGGRVVDRQEVRQDVDGRISVAAPARLEGRVYDDSDLNGVFDSGKDAPVSDVTVWLDENTSVQTDANGMYRFDQVKPGRTVCARISRTCPPTWFSRITPRGKSPFCLIATTRRISRLSTPAV